MNTAPYITGLTMVCIFAGLLIVGSALLVCLKFRANFRLFLGGVFAYLLIDGAYMLFLEIAQNSAGLKQIYLANTILVENVLFILQGVVFGFGAYYCARLLKVSRVFQVKHGLGVAAGMASYNTYLVYMRPQISNILLLKSYNDLVGAQTPPENMTEAEIEEIYSLTEQITTTPMLQVWLALLEVILVFAAIASISYLACSANFGRKSLIPVAMVTFVAYHILLANLNTYTSFWGGLAFEAVAAAVSVFFLAKVIINRNKAPQVRLKR